MADRFIPEMPRQYSFLDELDRDLASKAVAETAAEMIAQIRARKAEQRSPADLQQAA